MAHSNAGGGNVQISWLLGLEDMNKQARFSNEQYNCIGHMVSINSTNSYLAPTCVPSHTNYIATEMIKTQLTVSVHG